MAEEIQGWIQLDECIADYIVESEQSNHKQFKLSHIAFRGMDELGLKAFYAIRSVKLPVNANQTVYLPSDYRGYSKVGVFNATGHIIPLRYDNTLSTFADQLPDRFAKVEDNSLLTFCQGTNNIFFNYWNGYGYVNLFGIPSGQPNVGSFKIDREAGVIVLNVNYFYDYVCLEYVPSPDSTNGYYIPVQFREALISYLRWKDVISMPATSHMGMADKQYREKVFFNDRRVAIASYKPSYLEEAYQWNLENQRLAIKS